jgi:hypothetical protein
LRCGFRRPPAAWRFAPRTPWASANLGRSGRDSGTGRGRGRGSSIISRGGGDRSWQPGNMVPPMMPPPPPPPSPSWLWSAANVLEHQKGRVQNAVLGPGRRRPTEGFRVGLPGLGPSESNSRGLGRGRLRVHGAARARKGAGRPCDSDWVVRQGLRLGPTAEAQVLNLKPRPGLLT